MAASSMCEQQRSDEGGRFMACTFCDMHVAQRAVWHCDRRGDMWYGMLLMMLYGRLRVRSPRSAQPRAQWFKSTALRHALPCCGMLAISDTHGSVFRSQRALDSNYF